MNRLQERPISMVIGALGGEGGGVLTTWVVRAAEMCSFPTQSTSIPGVAQRTGATSYYVEIYPAPHEQLGGQELVMGLYPAPGNMDIVVTSELMEAGRMLENGMVTPDRTTLIASTHRVYSVVEKSAMGDGLFRADRLDNAAQKLSKRAVLFDMATLAEKEGTVLNAIVLGVIAGSGELPIPVENFSESIRESGVAVESNLKGFEIGLSYMRGEFELPATPPEKKTRAAKPSANTLISRIAATYPAETQATVTEGVKRLVDYQGPTYAKLYLDRLDPILELDRERGGERNNWLLTLETGRYLALTMSYEDIIRVADLKSRRSRMQRVRAEVIARPDEPVRVTEFLKPGFDEVTSVMPPWLGRPIMNWARGNNWAKDFNFAMRVRSNTINGFFRLWALSKLRFYRPKTFRYAEEQNAINAWLETIKQAASRHYQLAVEIAELANLRKGYSDTHKRGIENFKRIMEDIAIPCSTASKEPDWGANAVKQARAAALADPEGDALNKTMETLFKETLPNAAE
ncbi:MAG: indolepyruvate oxidoreductase subunit beta family protein [Pseudomonadota bacterium]|nr:indolepyruvate oxidoreductase subunit beta family protein [Pseudomonadota bacterium]